MTEEDRLQDILPSFLEECSDDLGVWERQCLALEQDPSQDRLSALFRAAHNIKGNARVVGLDRLAQFVHKAEDFISLVFNGHIRPESTIVQLLLEVHSLLDLWTTRLKVDHSFVPEQDIAGLRAKMKVLMEPFKPETDSRYVPGELVEFPVQTSKKASTLEPVPTPDPDTASKEKPPTTFDRHETIRVPTAKIDALMQIIGELSTQQATILHCLKNGQSDDKLCHDAARVASKLTRELQMQTMGLRLVTLERLFQRLEHAARDIANNQGKTIQVLLSGAEVELDKIVIERMTDALTHMVRNAVDHGIETPDTRKNKPRIATLRLSAIQTAGSVTIEVADDGRGINRDNVTKKAEQKGLIPEGQVLSAEQVYDLLFLPGFSTAPQITEVSGRGVGLDVVRRTIDQLNGSIEIKSSLGEGTRFEITLPTNVSIIDSLILEVHGVSYVVPIQDIVEVIDLKTYKIHSTHGSSRMIVLRDRAVLVSPLSAHLPAQPRPHPSEPKLETYGPEPAMIIELGSQLIAFAFDRVLGQQPVVIRKIAPYIANIPGFSGSTVLANGEPTIILSPKVLARQCLQLEQAG